jgi:hypothetical protein
MKHKATGKDIRFISCENSYKKGREAEEKTTEMIDF